MDTKRCSKCGEVKDVSEFYRNSSRPLGVTALCKPCHQSMKYDQCPICKRRKTKRAPICIQCKTQGSKARKQYKKLVSTAKQRFWKRIDNKADENGCWNWIGSCATNNGYGRFYDYERQQHYVAHRYMFKLIHGNIPDGMEVCHKCDNPLCVNPDHLFLATHQGNMLDALDKGRLDLETWKGAKNAKTITPPTRMAMP